MGFLLGIAGASFYLIIALAFVCYFFASFADQPLPQAPRPGEADDTARN
jgi:hypothetical protein